MHGIRASLVVSLVWFAASHVAADDWPAARPITMFTAASDRLVRILPGQSVGDLVGFADAPRGRYATAEMYVRQPDRSYHLMRTATLVNPVAPVNALLAPNGAFVTFDNWHNLGYGQVVAIYRPDGTLVKSYTLEQLYANRDLSDVPTSASSRAWRCAPFFFVTTEGAEAYTREFSGGEFLFDMNSGSVRYVPGRVRECPAPQPQWDR